MESTLDQLLTSTNEDKEITMRRGVLELFINDVTEFFAM